MTSFASSMERPIPATSLWMRANLPTVTTYLERPGFVEDWHTTSRQSQGNPSKCNPWKQLGGFKLISRHSSGGLQVAPAFSLNSWQTASGIHPQGLVYTDPMKTLRRHRSTHSCGWASFHLCCLSFVGLWVPLLYVCLGFSVSLFNKPTSAHSSTSLG